MSEADQEDLQRAKRWTGWTALVERHWKAHRPKVWEALGEPGLLDQAIEDAAQDAEAYEHQLRRQGVNAFEAHNRAVREFVALPDVS